MLWHEILVSNSDVGKSNKTWGETDDLIDMVICDSLIPPKEEAVSAGLHHGLDEWKPFAGTVEVLRTLEQFLF